MSLALDPGPPPGGGAVTRAAPRTSLRIGIVAENYFPTLGGIQEHVLHLRRFLVAAGAEVTVLTGDVGPVDGPAGPPDADERVERVGPAVRYGVNGTYTYATFGLQAARRVRQLLRERAFDVVNLHGPCDAGLPTLVNTLYRGPKVLTLHSCFPHAWWRHLAVPYYRWVFRRAAGVIAVSPATRDAMARYARFSAQIVPNGVDAAYWAAGRSTPAYREPGTRTLVYLGRLEARNGFDLLLEAFTRVARARPEVRLLVAGDGPLREQYQRAIPDDVRGRVRFLGAVYGERPGLFASSDLMIIPARAIGFSIMVLESFAAGLPVVALPALGVGQAGDHWRNVLLAGEPTAESLATATLAALDGDHAARIAAGRDIAAEYDWSAVGPRILQVLERAAAGGRVG
jgi:phosphatidylinositol alpha-mannosyltransferase